MHKIAVIYYSDSGETAAMAEQIALGADSFDSEAELIAVFDFILEDVNQYDAYAFGCPANSNEELEEYEFEPVFSYISDVLANRPIVIFGSYTTGTGEWMDKWQARCEAMDLNLIAPGLKVKGAADQDELDDCQELGESLAEHLSL